MKKFMQGVNRFIRDEEGVTAIEYGLLAALIAVMVIAGASVIGTQLDTLFLGVGDCLKSPPGALCTWN